MRSQKGFSLVGVIVSAGVAMIVMTTLANQTVNLGNNPSGDSTDLTTHLAGTPIQALIDSYAANNRYINVTKVELFKSTMKMDGVTPNTTSPYEFKVKLVATEKSVAGLKMFVDGPTIVLNVMGGVIASTNACAISGGGVKLTLSKTHQFSGNGGSAGSTTGYHDFCSQTGVYQNGNNGWVYLTASAPNSVGKRNYTVTSTCAMQGCGAGAMSIMVDCFDFL